MIISRTPFRISFAGGGSDMPSFYRREMGAVVSTTIDKYMYIAIHPHFDKNKIQLKINSEINTLIYMIKETYKINLLYNSNILDFVLLYYNENLSIDNKLKIKKYLLEFNEEYPINRD